MANCIGAGGVDVGDIKMFIIDGDSDVDNTAMLISLGVRDIMT